MSKYTSHGSYTNHYYWALYVLLISLRFSFTITHSPGYIFPDEYFQSVELGVHDVYKNACSLLSWEFNPIRYGPVRSRTSIYPFVHLPIYTAKKMANLPPDAKPSGDDLVNLILLPVRLFTTLLSFIPDVFIYYVSKKLEKSPDKGMPISLLLYSSMAYGGLLYNTRTLSNNWETVFVCIFCFLSLQSSFLNILLEAAIGAFGIFLRPTFPLFVTPFIALQLHTILRSPNRFVYVTFIIPLAVFTACVVSGFLIYSDTLYYHGDKMPDLADLIIIPLRFLKYNSAAETLGEHGLHPWYHYFVIHWPLILTPVLTFLVLIPPSKKGFKDCLRYTVWLSVIIPTLFLSSCPHKETRFILPSLPFAACLASLRVKRLGPLLFFWFIYQAGLVVFWGYLHQAGILQFLRSLPVNDANDVSLNIFYKTYMPPRFAFGEPKTSIISIPAECKKLAPFGSCGCDRVLDFAGRPQNELFQFLDCLKIYALPDMIIRVIFPGSILPLQGNLNDYGKVLRIDTFVPHLSTENLPSFTMPDCPVNMDYLECLPAFWEILRNQLSLHSYKISLS